MKKKIGLAVLASIALTAVAGCQIEEQRIIYNGESRSKSQVEEIIADQLEVENPDLDLEVTISEEDD